MSACRHMVASLPPPERTPPLSTPPRIIQIGFHRCGTRALAHLFAASGYDAVHWRVKRKNGFLNLARTLKKNIEAGEPPLKRMERYHFLSDLECRIDGQSWYGFKRFREIDAAYPGTRFLLNTRDKDGWLQSRLTHRGYAQKFMAAEGLTDIESCLQHWSAEWDAHLADVTAYFADRPRDLIRFDIDRDDIAVLIAQLPEYRLDPAHWQRIGRTNPAHAARNRAALETYVAQLAEPAAEG